MFKAPTAECFTATVFATAGLCIFFTVISFFLEAVVCTSAILAFLWTTFDAPFILTFKTPIISAVFQSFKPMFVLAALVPVLRVVATTTCQTPQTTQAILGIGACPAACIVASAVYAAT